MSIEEIRLEILRGSHQEHFKKAKDMYLIYEVGHPKRTEVEKVLSELTDKMNAVNPNA